MIPGLGLGAVVPFLLNGPITAVVLAAAVRRRSRISIVRHKRKKRLDTLEEQFPEALDFLARSMRAGHAFSISLEMVGEEMRRSAGPGVPRAVQRAEPGRAARYRAAQFHRARAAAGRALLHLVGAAAEADRRQPERNSLAPGLRHPRTLPAEGPGEGGQRARPAHRHHPDAAADRHHARPAGGGARLPAGHGRGSRRQDG